MPKDEVFSPDEPGTEVHEAALFDQFGNEVCRVKLPNPVLLGYGDIVAFRFRYLRDKQVITELGVICPECHINPLYNSYGDYICQPCREKGKQ
jgi:hypothetical protein